MDVELGILAGDLGADLRQQVVGTAIRRPDADLSRETFRRAGKRVETGAHRLLGRLAVAQKPLARRRERVTLRRFDEERRIDRAFEPRDPTAHRGRVELQRTAGTRQAAFARDGQKHLQIVPVRI